MTSEAPSLLPVDESWASALAIVAHPDDLEYGAASAVARWTSQGKRVVYCLATSGEAGIDAIEPERCGPLREAEEIASAAVVGVSVVEFLGYPDGMLTYGLELRRDIARAVRRHRPDVVLTANHHPTWMPGVLNQADHIAVGLCVLDGVRDAANRWVFRELLDEGLEPWAVRTVLVSGSPQAGHAVDVTEHLALGVASLKEHEAYLKGLGPQGMADPEEFLESMARATGSRLGKRFATAFEVVSF